jgi:hypothetical protein
MSQLSLRSINAAFICLAFGIGLGAWFAIDRVQGASLRPLHVELNLWGWVTLLIYGMGYHMLPRFAGRPLVRAQLAALQSWLAIGGVVLVALGWILSLGGWPLGQLLLIGGGIVQVGAAALFALLIGELLIG